MNRLIKYTTKEINNYKEGKVTIANNKEDLIKFVNNVSKKDSKSKIYLGKIDTITACKIKKDTGINIENYNLSLKKDAIKHILNSHSSEKEILRGQIPIEMEDFLKIERIILTADKIILSGKTKQGKPIIVFKKRIKETYILVSCVSDKRYNLEIKTMFKQKKNFATGDDI